MDNLTNILLRSITTIALAALLYGCGGGGGGSSEPAPLPTTDAPQPQPAAGAKVTLLLTDAPSDAFDKINVTLSSIELLGGDERVVLFEGVETIDLLMLENFADLFVVSDNVPADSYSKIRLQLDEVELVRKDSEGNVVQTLYPDLPANGKLDLNFRDSLALASGDNVVLQLDIDAKRSIHIVETGNGGYKFRPVVFVEAISDDFDGKAVRVNGEVVSIDSDAGTFDVCQQNASSADSDSDEGGSDSDSDDDSSDSDSDEGGSDSDSDDVSSDSDSDSSDDSDGDDGGTCLTVSTDNDTGFFNSNADSAAFADLMTGDNVLAIGKFSNDQTPVFDATVVAINTDNVFARYEGVIQTVADSSNRFDLLLDSGQGFVSDTAISVFVQSGTEIASEEGTPLDTSFIQPDVEAEIDGLLMLSNIDPDVLKAIYIALDVDLDDDDSGQDEEIRISGQVLSVDEPTDSLVLATDEGDRCVVLDDDADLFLIAEGDDVSTTDVIILSDVAAGANADIYGEESIDGCLIANTILVLD